VADWEGIVGGGLDDGVVEVLLVAAGFWSCCTLDPRLLDTVSRLEIWEASTDKPCLLTLPFSVKSLKISRRSRKRVCCSVLVARVVAWIIRLLAMLIASSTELVTGTEANGRQEAKVKWLRDGGGRRVSGSLFPASFGLLRGMAGFVCRTVFWETAKGLGPTCTCIVSDLASFEGSGELDSMMGFGIVVGVGV
jgi:hypothetical protein